MKNQPLLSIIVPVCNGKKTITYTIKSIIKLCPLKETEVIFQNSKSTDGTTEIINSYTKKYKNFFHYNEKDNGQSNAINRGVNRSKGKWVTWICSDDIFLPGFSKIFKALKYNKFDVIYGDCVFFENNNLIPAIGTENYQKNKLTLKRLYIQQPGTCIKKTKWLKCFGLNENLNWIMDYDLFMRLELIKAKFFRVKDFVSLALIHKDAKTSSGSVKRYFEYVKVFLKINIKNPKGFSIKPYIVYFIEYLIKKIKSQNETNNILEGFNKLFWKIADPTENMEIEQRFKKQKTTIVHYLSKIRE